MFAKLLLAPFAALMRLLRGSANLHPLVFSVTPGTRPAPRAADTRS